jgi:hypothetical protein
MQHNGPSGFLTRLKSLVNPVSDLVFFNIRFVSEGLMFLFIFMWDDDIEYGDKDNADEEGYNSYQRSCPIDCQRQQFQEGYINHDAGGEAQNERQLPVFRLADELGDTTADGGGTTCQCS